MADLSQEFRVWVVGAHGVATLELAGEIDLATAAQLGERLMAVIDASTGDVVVDLSAVTFLDPSGLVVFDAAHRRLVATNRRLTVRNPSPSVCRVLEVSGMADVWGVSPSAVENAGD